MQVLWFISIILYQFRPANSWWWGGDYNWPWEERYHFPGFFTSTMTPFVNHTETKISSIWDTPDYRIEEPHYLIYAENFAHEMERPYRNSPPYKQSRTIWGWYWPSLLHIKRDRMCFSDHSSTTYDVSQIPCSLTSTSGRYLLAVSGDQHWNNPLREASLRDNTYRLLRLLTRVEREMGCFCNTVYRRLTVLAGCAVITTKHILTTATSTALILRSYGHLKNLEHILGGWYDTDVNAYNASMYFTPSRIHIHPMYTYDYEVNVSHPIPAMFDLSVWSATYTFYGGFFYTTNVIICKRAASGWFEYTSTIPRPGDMSIVAGFQFMKAYRRRPMPWFRYTIKTDNYVWPCPKSDWHWFHCLMGEYWGKFGFDSGGGLAAAFKNQGWRRDGMTGLCAFSLKLRSIQTTHYFTVVDTWPVLDFMYDAFLGLKPPVYLDDRFENTKWASPVPYWGEYIPYHYNFGYEAYYQVGFVPRYRR